MLCDIFLLNNFTTAILVSKMEDFGFEWRVIVTDTHKKKSPNTSKFHNSLYIR